MQAFETACCMTSSEHGDDLPGLLHNWGVGLSAMAEQLNVSKMPTDLISMHAQCNYDAMSSTWKMFATNYTYLT